MQKRDFETYQKRFRDFEILLKFSETHVFWGTIRHPLCSKKKSQSGMRKLNHKQDRQLVCGFLASSLVFIFAVIGHDTINIPEIFQAFTVLPVTL